MHLLKMLLVAFCTLYSTLLMANEVERWNSLALQAIRINKTPPPVAARNLAIIHVGMFDTLNSITPKYSPYLLQVQSSNKLIIDVAVAKTARDLLVKTYPTHSPLWDEQLKITLDKYSDEFLKLESMDLGAYVAEKIWEQRQDDLRLAQNSLFDKNVDIEAGIWVPTPPNFDLGLLPSWGKTKPFGLLKGSQFRQDGPPKLFSSEYAKDYNEVKEYGGKTGSKRSAEQTLIAKFWSDGAGTVTPPGHWNRIALKIAKEKKLDLLESARLMALLNIALADAGISCWDMKYTFNFWRPITAIAEADRDDNIQTESQTNWEPLLITPPFPDYVSGHSLFSSSAATILELYFGTDKMNFSSEAEGTPGVIRSYSRFSEAASEAGKSRVYGGIHYESANRDGQRAGRKIGEFLFSTLLLKK